MSRLFSSVSELQHHLKDSIREGIEHKLMKIVLEIVQKYVDKNVYHNPFKKEGSEFAYDRTMELMNSITIGELKMGTKYATFEVYMDAEKIRASETDEGYWNQHANIDYTQDTSNYIPQWIEEGTNGSLWDWQPTHYMADSYFELSDGSLARELADALRREGWNVIRVS
ncbi:hypothetical protein LLR47_19320 [Bacillus cereus]|uniref:hypothetical protein n=1 Tax=Bacillus cereus TaxID=1396 RepID=UPI001D13CB77|nr:hypothetical protein [Bacillus cereus]MCC3687363.1 hypothetical protein [Bacillus cereus]